MRIATLMGSHIHKGRRLLRESCDGLTESQRIIVEGIYNEFVPLIEASLTADQVKGIFKKSKTSRNYLFLEITWN